MVLSSGIFLNTLPKNVKFTDLFELDQNFSYQVMLKSCKMFSFITSIFMFLDFIMFGEEYYSMTEVTRKLFSKYDIAVLIIFISKLQE